MTTPWQPGFQGTFNVAPTFTDPHDGSPSAYLALVASTTTAGFTLQNATPGIITWNAPNDNQPHWFIAIGNTVVGSAETGGAISCTFTSPTGSSHLGTLDAGGNAGGTKNWNQLTGVVAPGTTVTIAQSSALTAGAAVAFAGIWAA